MNGRCVSSWITPVPVLPEHAPPLDLLPRPPADHRGARRDRSARGADGPCPERWWETVPSCWPTGDPNEVVRVVANPYYWDRDNVALNAIEFIPIDSIDSEERSFRAGQLHVTGSMPLVKIPVYRESGAEMFRSDPYLGIYYYIFNVEKPPFDDARVRRALSLAVDRRLLVEKVTGGGEDPAYSFYPSLCSLRTRRPVRRGCGRSAKTCWPKRGIPDGEGFPSFELLYNTSESHRMVAETIQQMWRVNLGIDARLFNQEWKVYLDSRDMGDFEVARAGWVPQYDDVSIFADLLLAEIIRTTAVVGRTRPTPPWSIRRIRSWILRTRTPLPAVRGDPAGRYAGDAALLLPEQLPDPAGGSGVGPQRRGPPSL